MTAVLDVKNLEVAFRTPLGPIHALQDVSFTVPERTIVGIVGESGCGKSTVVWSICRLLAATGKLPRRASIYSFSGPDDITESCALLQTTDD